MNPKKTLYNVVCNVQWRLSFLLSIKFLFPLQENDSSPCEGLWLKTNHIVWLEKFPFTLWLHNSLHTKPLLSSPSSLHSKTLLVHLWVHTKPLIMTLVIAFKTLLLPHLWLHIKTLPLDTLYPKLLLFLHSRTQDLHLQSVGEQVVQGIGNNNVW
jgi:hypothetical protein